jgi:beta-lactamase class A
MPRLLLCCALLIGSNLLAASLDVAGLKSDLAALAEPFPGRVGVCVRDSTHMACIRGDERFSMQSVVKLLTGVAVLHSVDRRESRLDEPVIVYKKDLSLAVQPLSKLVGKDGFHTTVGDLIRRGIIDSDSAANDFLMAKLGGPAVVHRILQQMGVRGIRIDRDERHLQTETEGLRWRSEFVDAEVLDRARAANPKTNIAKAYAAYAKDSRDTATPKGMTDFLWKLRAGQLVSRSSTAFALQAMDECATFPDRLKAGTAFGWKIAHKTGTSETLQGVTVATNDVGIFTAPDGSNLAVTVFVADSVAASETRAALMAKIAAAAIGRYR